MNQIDYTFKYRFTYIVAIIPILGSIILYWLDNYGKQNVFIDAYPLLGLILWLIGFLMIISAIQWIYSTNIELLKVDNNAPSKNSWAGAIALSIILIGIIWYIFLIYKYSKSSEKVTNNNVNSITAFILLTFLTPIGIVYVQNKYNQIAMGQIQIENNNDEEKNAKNYIEQYKNQYPKESIKEGLKNMEISEENIERYLNKYF